MKDEFIYIGDGVYAKPDPGGGGVWLYANSHVAPTDKVYLDSYTFENLVSVLGYTLYPIQKGIPF